MTAPHRTFSPSRLGEISTPALVLDRGRLQANIDRVANLARKFGVSLRPHMKTGKSADIAKLVTESGNPGVTVSTIREAEYFFEHGFRDIVYAVGIVPQKLDRVAALNERGAMICVILDQAGTARAVAARAESLGTVFDVRIELDTDGHRAGIEPDDPELLEIAAILEGSPFTRLRGVLTHAGGSYECASIEAIELHAEQERSRCVIAAERLRAAGFPCESVSTGSTPTVLCARNMDGVTEIRPGVYMFFDLFQAGLGVCELTDISLSVLATVIGHKRSHRRLIVDAGGLALSKDRATASQPTDCGYGLVAHAESGEIIAGMQVSAANQEHGMIQLEQPDDLEDYPVGSRLRILPNHSCMTAAAHDRYFVVDGGDEVVAEWKRCTGW